MANRFNSRVVYGVLLSLLSLGCCNEFAASSFNPVLKLYGLAFCLQAGIALLYLSYQRDRRSTLSTRHFSQSE